MKTLVLLACVSLSCSAFAQGGLPDKPYVYVEGKAEIEKPPDMVTLRFELVARNPDQAKHDGWSAFNTGSRRNGLAPL